MALNIQSMFEGHPLVQQHLVRHQHSPRTRTLKPHSTIRVFARTCVHVTASVVSWAARQTSLPGNTPPQLACRAAPVAGFASSCRHAGQTTSLGTLLCISFLCMYQQMAALVGICWLALAVSPFVRQRHACRFSSGSPLTTTLLLSRHAPSSNEQGAYMRNLAVQTHLAVQTRTVLNG